MTTPTVSLVLTEDEALVLFEYLASKPTRLPERESAEQRVLWAVEALLEKELVVPFLANYRDRVDAARRRILQE